MHAWSMLFAFWLLLVQLPTTQSVVERIPRLTTAEGAHLERFSVEGRIASLAVKYRCVRAGDRCSLYLESDDGTPMLLAADDQLICYDAYKGKVYYGARASFVWELRIDDEQALQFNFSFNSAGRDGSLKPNRIDIDLPSFVKKTKMFEQLPDGRLRATTRSEHGGTLVALLDANTPSVVQQIDI